MPLLGSFCLLFALVLAAYCLVAGIVALAGGHPASLRLGETARRAGMASFLATAVAALALVWAALNNDFSLAYILHHTNRALSTPYKLAALWSGQEGSLLFWALLLSAYGFVLRLRHKVDRRLVAHASVVLAGIQVFFLLLVNFIANPFGLMDRIAADGNGLNPLLQYPEMVIHPPMLYLGYVGMSVPFAFGLAALIMKYPGEKWIHITRRWTMVAWLFLTCGIILGAHWAYAVLGWGGYWGWDPVENASLLPWLSGTAFLHSVMMQEKRGMMKVWNVWLIFTTFMLSILGTFLTRSGVVNSVHSFAQSSIGTWFVGDFGRVSGFPWFYWYPGFLEIILAVCLFFFIRNRDHLKAENQLESMVSRESSFLFNNVVLLLACFSVLCGTLAPILSEWFQGHKISVGPVYFNNINVPIGLFLIFLTGVGPLLAWRNTSFASIVRNFTIPFGMMVVTAIALLAGGMRPWKEIYAFYAYVAFCVSALVISTIALEFYRGGRVLQGKLGSSIFGAMYHLTRRNTRRYGGYVVHFGIVVIMIGIAGKAFNQEKEQEMALHDKLQIAGYTLVSQNYTEDDNANYSSRSAVLDVYKKGKFVTTLYPEQRMFKASQQSDTMVANRSTMLEDLYVIYAGANLTTHNPIIKVFLNPLVSWIWVGWFIMIFGTGLALVPNTAPLRATLPVTATAGSFEEKGMQPAGVSK